MTAKLCRHLLLALAAPALLATCVRDVRLARAPGRAQVARDVSDLRQSDEALARALADARAAPFADYDGAAAAAQRMTLAAARLPGDLHRVYAGRRAARLDPALRACLDAVARKLARVEDDKTRNAVLQSGRAGGTPPPPALPAGDDAGPARQALAGACEAEDAAVRLGALGGGLGFLLAAALLLRGARPAVSVKKAGPAAAFGLEL